MRKKFLYQPSGRANETHAFIAGHNDGLYCVNHAQGCSHGCKYPCYAFKMAERFRKTRYKEWINPTIYTSAPEIIKKELARFGGAINSVFMCFTTDPYPYNNLVMRNLTNELTRIFVNMEIDVITLTKGSYDHSLDCWA